jgi:DNA polymerase-1
MVAFDIETIPQAKHITSIAFSWAPGKALSVPFYFPSNLNPHAPSYWSENDEPIVLDALQRILCSEVPKCAHNAVYDLHYLRYYWGLQVRFDPPSLDTMCAHHLLWPTLPKSLAFVMSLYTRYPYHKDLAHAGDYNSGWRYNGLDAIGTRAVALVLAPLLNREGVKRCYDLCVHPILAPAAQITALGLRVNQDFRRATIGAELRKLSYTRQEMSGILSLPNFNPGSTVQAANALYKTLGFPVQFHRKTKKVTTSWKEVGRRLEKLATTTRQTDFLAALKTYRGAQNVLTNWLGYDLKAGREDTLPDNCLVTSYNIAGTVSGRPSSSKADPDAEEKVAAEGRNLLNIPHGPCRQMVVPDDFYDAPAENGERLTFVVADLEQAEAKSVAYESGCKFLIEAFESGKNVHVVSAQVIFPGVEVVKNPEQESPYQRAKRCVHLLDYGGSEHVMAPILGIPKSECRDMITRWFTMCPEIRVYQELIWSLILRYRQLVTPYGRRLQFLGDLREGRDNKAKRLGLAFVPQSTVGDKTNEVMGIIHAELRPPERILISHYDALILQVRKSRADYWQQRLRELYSTPITSVQTKRTYRIGVEVKQGANWNEL